MKRMKTPHLDSFSDALIHSYSGTLVVNSRGRGYRVKQGRGLNKEFNCLESLVYLRTNGSIHWNGDYNLVEVYRCRVQGWGAGSLQGG